MAIQISEQGSREGILKRIDALAPTDTANVLEQAQAEALKAYLTSEVNALEAEFNGVHVVAQSTASKGRRQLTADVIGLKLSL